MPYDLRYSVHYIILSLFKWCNSDFGSDYYSPRGEMNEIALCVELSYKSKKVLGSITRPGSRYDDLLHDGDWDVVLEYNSDTQYDVRHTIYIWRC